MVTKQEPATLVAKPKPGDAYLPVIKAEIQTLERHLEEAGLIDVARRAMRSRISYLSSFV